LTTAILAARALRSLALVMLIIANSSIALSYAATASSISRSKALGSSVGALRAYAKVDPPALALRQPGSLRDVPPPIALRAAATTRCQSLARSCCVSRRATRAVC